MIPLNVVESYADTHGIAIDEAAVIFKELEAFLTLASMTSREPTVLIDEAWHAFILHTKEYADYCATVFGKFIHHVPKKSQLRALVLVTPDCSSNCDSYSSTEA